jgi:alpha-galactosidase
MQGDERAAGRNGKPLHSRSGETRGQMELLTLIMLAVVSPSAIGDDTVKTNDDRLVRRDPIGSQTEMNMAAQWAREHLTGSEPSVPFSFIYDARPSADLLKSWEFNSSRRDLDRRRTEYTLTYTDRASGLVCRCTAVVFADCPAVEWMLRFEDTGDRDTAILERIEPLDITITRPGPCAFTLHHSLGDSNSADSFKPVDDVFAPDGRVTLAPSGGRSSDPHMPFVNLDWESGGMAVAVGWSGQWEAEFAGAGDRAVRARAGMQLVHLRLHPGESIRTPRILAILWNGADPIRGNHLMRRIIMEHYAPRRNGKLVLAPICGTANEVDPDGSYEGPHIKVMKPLADRGVEVFWSDMDPQQWYPGGFPGGTGTWEVDTAKYPHGLKAIGEAARAAGLEYLLWFEPERVAFGTAIDRDHPEWVMKTDWPGSGLFAMNIPEARRWITDLIDKHVTDAGLQWIRWDFNIDPLGFWRSSDEPDRQGMTEIRYIEGLYAMWDELIRRHPGLVIDLCASGGRRIDLESLTRGVPLWHSDLQCFGPKPAADQLQNAGLWRWVPMHGCGDFAYEPSYVFRSAMTTGNILCAGNERGSVSTADPDTADAVKLTVAIYKTLRPYMLGDFYPLTAHSAAGDVWFAYQFHRPDMGAGMVMAFRREASPEESVVLKLHRLDPDAVYTIRNLDDETTSEATGRKLMEEGLGVTIRETAAAAMITYKC